MLGVDEWLRCTVFGDRPAQGNPTVVVRLRAWPDDATLRHWAAQADAHEVTFVCANGDAPVRLRWFGPLGEVPDCGHGALAAAAALGNALPEGRNLHDGMHEGLHDGMRDGLHDAVAGPHGVTRSIGYVAGLPTVGMPRMTLSELPRDAVDIGLPVERLFDAGRDYLAVVADEAALREWTPDTGRLAALARIGLIVTAPAANAVAHFRFFAPRAGIPEDFGSASAIPALASYWLESTRSDGVFSQNGPDGGDLSITARLGDATVCVSARVHEGARGRLADWTRPHMAPLSQRAF